MINEHATVSATLAVMGIIGAFVWMVHGSTHIEPQYYYGYFYDLEKGTLFVDVRTKPAPIQTPGGGNAGMLAAVFSCGQCEDKATHFVGWIERYSPEAQQLIDAERQEAGDLADPDTTETITRGHQIAPLPARGSEPQWLPASSADAAQVLRVALQRCGNAGPNRAQACNPVDTDLP